MVRNSQRPTVSPPRGAAKHAKASEGLAADRPVDALDEPGDTHPRSETRLSTRPQMSAVDDELWAGSMIGMPVLAVPPAELRLLPLDPRAAFLLSQMDGRTDLDTVLELSAMSRAKALRLVRQLYVSGVVDFKYR